MPNFNDIFYWEEWDDIGEKFEMFMNCEALRDIGNDIKDGDEFETIYFDKQKLELIFYKKHEDNNPIVKKFVLCEHDLSK